MNVKCEKNHQAPEPGIHPLQERTCTGVRVSQVLLEGNERGAASFLIQREAEMCVWGGN